MQFKSEIQTSLVQNNQKSSKTTYVCTRYRVFTYLRSLGFKEYKTVPDCKNPQFNVFLFDNTPELEQAVDKFYIEAARNGKLKTTITS